MKTPEEIIDYLDRWIIHALERPEMYTSSPHEFERMFIFLEDLRSFILDAGTPPGPWQFPNRYTTYLVAKGYGSSTFSRLMDNSNFDELVGFLKDFLVSENRPLKDSR